MQQKFPLLAQLHTFLQAVHKNDIKPINLLLLYVLSKKGLANGTLAKYNNTTYLFASKKDHVSYFVRHYSK